MRIFLGFFLDYAELYYNGEIGGRLGTAEDSVEQRDGGRLGTAEDSVEQRDGGRLALQ